ncbi:MAG TPA: VOC family protein [Ohtaekwangia sp.]|uniref:VOC family protein n=1 Tax=Ohtaekwangia sp. TaxID=2066019 RepID=UPI002F91EE60
MKLSLGRMVILVHDYDQAFRFYEKTLNARKLYDMTTDSGQRYLHIAFSDQDTAGIWFLKATSPTQQANVGRQTQGQPTFVLYTDSFNQLHQQLQQHNVQIIRPPVTDAGATFLHFLDLYGNEIVLAQIEH